VSFAAVGAVAPVFIVSAGLSQSLQAKRLTAYNLVYPIGQVLGGAIIGAFAAANASYSQRFWVSATFMLVILVLIWLTSARPAQRIQITAPAGLSARSRLSHRANWARCSCPLLGCFC
jgi:MFS family permease